jgi:hypothetical protein
MSSSLSVFLHQFSCLLVAGWFLIWMIPKYGLLDVGVRVFEACSGRFLLDVSGNSITSRFHEASEKLWLMSRLPRFSLTLRRSPCCRILAAAAVDSLDQFSVSTCSFPFMILYIINISAWLRRASSMNMPRSCSLVSSSAPLQGGHHSHSTFLDFFYDRVVLLAPW